jgi:hypothetical protein
LKKKKIIFNLNYKQIIGFTPYGAYFNINYFFIQLKNLKSFFSKKYGLFIYFICSNNLYGKQCIMDATFATTKRDTNLNSMAVFFDLDKNKSLLYRLKIQKFLLIGVSKYGNSAGLVDYFFNTYSDAFFSIYFFTLFFFRCLA